MAMERQRSKLSIQMAKCLPCVAVLVVLRWCSPLSFLAAPTLPARSRGHASLCRQQMAPQRQGLTALRVAMPPLGKDQAYAPDPGVQKRGREYARRIEDILLAGRDLYAKMKQMQDPPKRIYLIGPNGNKALDVGGCLGEALAYKPHPDGRWFTERERGDPSNPKVRFWFAQSDKLVAEKARISPVDLWMEDPEEYFQVEDEVLKEFAELDDVGEPMLCHVGEGAPARESAREIMKDGIKVWLDIDSERAWFNTQWVPSTGLAVKRPAEFAERPPVWALAQGWESDPDDMEAKLDFQKILEERRQVYEEVADVRVRVDAGDIAKNAYWAAERLIKAIKTHLGVEDEDVIDVQEEVLELDLTKFLEGARLAQYTKPALEWCDEMGAATLEDVIENVEEFSEALKLKPLEKKRLEKASVAAAEKLK